MNEIRINAGTRSGIPLFKKFGMFNSGIVNVDRYERDAPLFRRCRTSSLRMDLFIGERSMDLGNIADNTIDDIVYHWEKSDRLVALLTANGVSPYYSWCYVPLPLQPEGGNYRSVPVSWEKYQEVMGEFARHYREMGSPLGYQEIYNEPINRGAFFDGTVADYNTMYRYGASGIREGDSSALVGGSAEAFAHSTEECEENVQSFLDYVKENNLPLDFFSFHTYGSKNKVYLERVRLIRELLASEPRFHNVGMHINEFNTVPPPWPYRKTILELPALLPQILTAIEDLLEETDVELVHWAQFLESSVDALGLVDRHGKLLPGFYAFELYARMPADRIKTDTPESYGCMASCNERRVSAILWNKSDEALPVRLTIDDIPKQFSSIDVCVIDAEFLDGLSKDYQLRPKVRLRVPVIKGSATFTGFCLGIHDVVYLEGNAYVPNEHINWGLVPGRVMHYYPDRMKMTYAEYDKDSGAVFLGANGSAGDGTSVSVEFDGAADRIILERKLLSGTADLCVRVDFLTGDGYTKAVQFGGTPTSMHHGTKRLPDEVAPLRDRQLLLLQYAPPCWNGRGLITFLSQQASADYSETIKFISQDKEYFSSLLD